MAKAKSGGKEPRDGTWFVRELRKELRRLFDYSAIAAALGRPTSTVRNWFHKKRFPAEELVEILKHSHALRESVPETVEELRAPAGWNVDVEQMTFPARQSLRSRLKAKLQRSTQPGGLGEVLDVFDDKVRGYRPLAKQFEEEVSRLFQTMSDVDTFVFVSLSEIPYEWSAAEGLGLVGGEIVDAINNGAWFIYCTPDADLVRQLQEIGILGVSPPDTVKGRFVEYGDALSRIHQGPRASFKAKLEKQLHWVPWKSQLFMQIGHKYILFIPGETGRPVRGSAVFPVGNATESLPLSAPLDRMTTDALERCIMHTVRQANLPDLLDHLQTPRAHHDSQD